MSDKNNAADAKSSKPSSGSSGGADLSNRVSGTLARLSDELSRASPTQQAIAGGGSGCLAGYVVGRLGRTAALALGGGLICLQLAQQRGLISINWNRVERQARQAVDEVAEIAADENRPGVRGRGGGGLPQFIDQAKQVFATQRYFAATFAGGFLIGLAAS